jgi:hypothetical protein
VEAYRLCALASREGVIAVARPFRERSDKSGEEPQGDLFDAALLEAIRTRLPELYGEDSEVLKGVLGSFR